MSAYSAKAVREALRKIGFRPFGKGNASGHEIWRNQNNCRIRPVMRKKDVHIRTLYCLGLDLERMGICDRKKFVSLIKLQTF
ncbi:MAG: hypothetical protein ACP5U1_12115 [Desulfomonilaceae bacterium]